MGDGSVKAPVFDDMQAASAGAAVAAFRADEGEGRHLADESLPAVLNLRLSALSLSFGFWHP